MAGRETLTLPIEVRILAPQQMRSKEWSPDVEERRIAKHRRRAAKRAMTKLLANLTIPGQPGCPGFVMMSYVHDRELDRLGIRTVLRLVINL